jgi:signal transduction histidine kinase
VKRQARLLEQKNRELESTNLERLRMLIELGQELAAQHEPPMVLQKFCRATQQIIDAESVTVGMLDNDGRTLRHFFRCNSKGEIEREGDVPALVQTALHRVTAERAPVRLSEADDLLLEAEDDASSPRSFLGAAIVSAAATCGGSTSVNKRNADEFSEADERLAATLATQVAVAYENANLYAEAQHHATELRMEMAVRKQAEHERARLLVREQSARAEAEAANRNKDEFLATLSHELRTPLTAILGWSHLMRSKGLNEEEFMRGLDTIERNARSQSQLIDDLLDVSRIITGKLQIERTSVDLSKVIESAFESIRPGAEAKSIRFNTSFNGCSCRVFGDSTRLQQIFWNLFSNAVKFTPRGGEVNVSVAAVDSRVKVAVTDNGIGIDPDFVPFIFDRFRQADGSTTREHGGLGLGLAIVRHLVELHEGRVMSKAAGRIWAQLSRSRCRAPGAPRLTRTGAPSFLRVTTCRAFGASVLLNGVKVLVVDDEADSRDLLTTILTQCGSDVRCSESAADAMQTFHEWHPDLLVSDIGMPNEDGYSLIRRLRQLESDCGGGIPAMALTAYATDEDRLQALSAGFQIHVAKPIEPEKFVTSLASILEPRD